ncbi:MAG TPA: hypothetical protein VJ385_01555 [Fibrobacteria bacterium]|nr:hypothetical protein [Fibrobacteria bacterium]
MPKSTLKIRVFVSILLLFGIRAQAIVYNRSVVWAPTFEQLTQFEVEFFGTNSSNHPDFTTTQTSAQTKVKINASLAAAYAKGIRVIDIFFFQSRAMIDPGYVAPEQIPWADATEDWLSAVDTFNNGHTSDPFRLRIRVQAWSTNLYYSLRTKTPYNVPSAISQYADMPFDPCFHILSSTDACFSSSSLDKYYYKSLTQDAVNGDGLLAFTPNLANPVMRNRIRTYVETVIDEVKNLTGSNTVIEQVSLSLDPGNESSIMGMDNKMISFSNGKYDPNGSFRSKINFFRNREFFLKETYKIFSDAVHGKSNHNTAIPIKSSVFFQAWVMDGRTRGSFDLYALLNGTGIDALHHTTWPDGGYNAHLKGVAYSASIASRLGMEFDTEFSWAHFDRSIVLNSAPMVWSASKLTDQNAQDFFSQAKAGIEYGAHGFTYAGWTMHEITTPPYVFQSAPFYYQPRPDWKRIIGGIGPSFPPGIPYDDSHLTDPGGLLTIANWTTPGPSTRKAIYISTIGRIECEEEQANPSTVDGVPCNWGIYLEWFDELATTYASEKVDIITDGMILANPGIFDDYAQVYVPFETSKKIETKVFNLLNQLGSGTKAKFAYQTSGTNNGSGTFAQWMAATSPYLSIPIVPTVLSPTLLQ